MSDQKPAPAPPDRCDKQSPADYSGHWRDWHRFDHSCRDPRFMWPDAATNAAKSTVAPAPPPVSVYCDARWKYLNAGQYGPRCVEPKDHAGPHRTKRGEVWPKEQPPASELFVHLDRDVMLARSEISRLCKGGAAHGSERWRMSIPVDEYRDSDRIFSRALGHIAPLRADLARARAECDAGSLLIEKIGADNQRLRRQNDELRAEVERLRGTK